MSSSPTGRTNSPTPPAQHDDDIQPSLETALNSFDEGGAGAGYGIHGLDYGTEIPNYGGMGFLGFTGSYDYMFEICTECLGFESLTEKMDACFPTVEPRSPSRSPIESRSRMTMSIASKEIAASENFPPNMTSLYENGRPRFNLRKKRSNGRLEIDMSRNMEPVMVRSEIDGGLRVEWVGFGQEHGEDEEREDSQVCEENQEKEGR